MSAEINIYNPEELGPPMGQYTHVTRVKANEFLFVAGMLSGDAAGNVIGEGEFDVQTAQVFRNIEAALKSAGASWANVVHPKVHGVSVARIPKDVSGRQVSAEYPARGRSAGQGSFPGRSADDRRHLIKRPSAPATRGVFAIWTRTCCNVQTRLAQRKLPR
jgi:enamine deaminase RidA (YjgF/YER057c/UK114 family)